MGGLEARGLRFSAKGRSLGRMSAGGIREDEKEIKVKAIGLGLNLSGCYYLL